MRLKDLHIYKSWSGDQMKGEITIMGENSSTTLTLTEEQCDKLIAVVASTLVESAKELAKTLVANTLEFKATKQITE